MPVPAFPALSINANRIGKQRAQNDQHHDPRRQPRKHPGKQNQTDQRHHHAPRHAQEIIRISPRPQMHLLQLHKFILKIRRLDLFVFRVHGSPDQFLRIRPPDPAAL